MRLGLVLLILSSASAWAGPGMTTTTEVTKSKGDCPEVGTAMPEAQGSPESCERRGFVSAVANVQGVCKAINVHKVGMNCEEDKRVQVTDLTPKDLSAIEEKSGVTQKDIKFGQNQTAYVGCGTDPKKLEMSQLTRVGPDSFMFIVHKVDKFGKPLPNGGLKPPCEVFGQQGSEMGVAVDEATVNFNSLKIVSLGETGRLKNSSIALVKLNLKPGRTLPQGNGMPVESGETGVTRVADSAPQPKPMFLMSAIGLNTARTGFLKNPDKGPLVQVCTNFGVQTVDKFSGEVASNCSSTGGQTGSFESTKSARFNSLAIKSILIGGNEQDKACVDLQNGLYTVNAPVTPEIAREIDAYAFPGRQRPMVKMADKSSPVRKN